MIIWTWSFRNKCLRCCRGPVRGSWHFHNLRRHIYLQIVLPSLCCLVSCVLQSARFSSLPSLCCLVSCVLQSARFSSYLCVPPPPPPHLRPAHFFRTARIFNLPLFSTDLPDLLPASLLVLINGAYFLSTYLSLFHPLLQFSLVQFSLAIIWTPPLTLRSLPAPPKP
jgi:hypothetical protein